MRQLLIPYKLVPSRSRLKPLLLTVLLCSRAAYPQPPSATLSLHAYLFYNKTGQLSKDILGENGPTLGNIITDSTSTFVVIEIKPGSGQNISRKTQVRLIAREGQNDAMAANSHPHQRVLLDKVSRIGPANNDDSTYIGFWLPETGCSSITLRASIVGAKAPPQNAQLGFACYE